LWATPAPSKSSRAATSCVAEPRRGKLVSICGASAARSRHRWLLDERGASSRPRAGADGELSGHRQARCHHEDCAPAAQTHVAVALNVVNQESCEANQRSRLVPRRRRRVVRADREEYPHYPQHGDGGEANEAAISPQPEYAVVRDEQLELIIDGRKRHHLPKAMAVACSKDWKLANRVQEIIVLDIAPLR